MPYFTTWDVNVFLSLLSWGLPEDVVKGMMKMIKKVQEEFSLEEARSYWVSNSPTLVKQTPPKDEFRKFKFVIEDSDKVRGKHRLYSLVNYLTLSTVKFKQEWRHRSIEERQKKVVDWCKFGDDFEQRRHQGRLTFSNPSPFYKNDYTKNLWKTWEVMGAMERWNWDRRLSVSQWYEGIHPGRFFLFYKENKIMEERNRGVPRGPCKDGYVYPRTPIFDWGPYEQLIEDLRCIDGSGLGEKAGIIVEHIDDMFLKV